MHRRWIWEYPDGRAHNEIDIITGVLHIFKEVAVLNQLPIRSEQHTVRVTISINLSKERFKMLKKLTKIST